MEYVIPEFPSLDLFFKTLEGKELLYKDNIETIKKSIKFGLKKFYVFYNTEMKPLKLRRCYKRSDRVVVLKMCFIFHDFKKALYCYDDINTIRKSDFIKMCNKINKVENKIVMIYESFLRKHLRSNIFIFDGKTEKDDLQVSLNRESQATQEMIEVKADFMNNSKRNETQSKYKIREIYNCTNKQMTHPASASDASKKETLHCTRKISEIEESKFQEIYPVKNGLLLYVYLIVIIDHFVLKKQDKIRGTKKDYIVFSKYHGWPTK